MEIGPGSLKVSTEEGVRIMSDVVADILLSEDPVRFDVEIGTIVIADLSILTNQFKVGKNASKIGSTKKVLQRVDG